MRNKIIRIVPLLAIMLGLTSCMQYPFPERDMNLSHDIVDEVVEKAIAFDFDKTADSIPSDLVDVVASYKVLLVGEMHYVQEHQEMIANLLKRLHSEGFRYYVQETSTSTALMIDCFIKGKLDALTADEKNTDLTLISELKSFNQLLREEGKEEEQISYIGFDLNHMRNEYKTALMHLVKIYQLPEDTFNFYSYDAPKIKHALEENELSNLPVSIIDELKYITEAEIASSEILKEWNDHNRENFIEKYVVKAIQNVKDDEKLIINAGAWHAQLMLHWNVTKDEKFRWLGMRLKEYFKENPDGLFSLFCNTYKGEMRNNLYRSDSFQYEAKKKLKKGYLMPYLMDAFNDSNVFIDFTTISNMSSVIGIQTPHDTIYLPVDEQFNGMLVYPEVTVPKSLKHYENE